MSEKQQKLLDRLPVETFSLPIQKIRRGYYSAAYFWREKKILENHDYAKKVLMQVFQKRDRAVLCGTDEAIAVLKLCSGQYSNQEKANKFFDAFQRQNQLIRKNHVERNYDGLRHSFEELVKLEIELDQLWLPKFHELNVSALYDGNFISPWETVMTIEGLPQYFAHLESIYLGILARRTLVATNVGEVVEAAQGKPVLFFADRFDHYENQTGDGYAAAKIGGAFGVATDIMGEWWGKKGIGTIPHALIACFMGDTVKATLAFARNYPDVPCISLVDFHNDCVKTSLVVAQRFKAEGLRLWGVRLDISETMVDFSIIENGQLGKEKPTGVTPLLVKNVRSSLDLHGFDDIRIVVSGGFNKDKIKYFEANNVPVDAYGCGSSLLKGSNDFTADIVQVDTMICSKVGRKYRPNDRLKKVV